MFCIFVLYYRFDICLDLVYLILETTVLSAETLQVVLVDECHHVEKKWHIKHRIEHGHYLTSDCEWYKVTESYRCRCNNCEVKGIEVALPYRMSLLESVHRKSTNNPTREKYECHEPELA